MHSSRTSYGLCGMHAYRRKKGLDMDAPARHARRLQDQYVPTQTAIKTSNCQIANGLKSTNTLCNNTWRNLYPWEEIHHINRQPADNRIENLELWDNSHPAGARVNDWISDAIHQVDGIRVHH